jgi:hypothetical protein
VVNELDAWARRAATLPAVFVNTTAEATRAGAEVLEAGARRNLLAATGGDLRLSRVRSGRGARVNLSVKTEGAGSRARSVVVPSGPVMLVEAATKAHRQPFAYTYNRRVMKRGGRPIHIPGVGIFARVQHPGTRGKQPIAKAFGQTAEDAGAAGLAVFARATRRHLTGGAP